MAFVRERSRALAECFRALLEPETEDNEIDRNAGLEVLADWVISQTQSVKKR